MSLNIVKQLKVNTKSKIRVGEIIPAVCEDRVVTIYSANDETSYISPAQDVLFKAHARVIAEDLHGDYDFAGGGQQVSPGILVPSDQIGCIIGKVDK